MKIGKKIIVFQKLPKISDTNAAISINKYEKNSTKYMAQLSLFFGITVCGIIFFQFIIKIRKKVQFERIKIDFLKNYKSVRCK